MKENWWNGWFILLHQWIWYWNVYLKIDEDDLLTCFTSIVYIHIQQQQTQQTMSACSSYGKVNVRIMSVMLRNVSVCCWYVLGEYISIRRTCERFVFWCSEKFGE